MRKNLLLSLALVIPALGIKAVLIDFSKIRSWTGEGENKAALAVSNDAGASDPHVYVWGYRWPAGETRTGEDMFKAVCEANDNLVLLTQITGTYGSTVCGIGVGEAKNLLEYIHFDFEAALESEFINFDYYSRNSLFGQSDAPGDNTPMICQEAIDLARTSGRNYIQHPIDQPHYGYPAYDYDCWPLADEGMYYGWWTSAWYAGYWSYWTAPKQDAEWMYSGTGFTGRQLSDGCIDGWSFVMFDNPKVGGVGEGTPPSTDPAKIIYCDSKTNSIPDITLAPREPAQEDFYSMDGRQLPKGPQSPGLYIVRKGNKSYKIIIH